MARARSRLTEDQRTRELEVFAESSRLVTSTLDLGEVLDRLAGIARLRLEVDIARIWLLDEEQEAVVLRAQTGTKREGVGFQQRFARGEGLAGWVLANGQPLVQPDVMTDPRLKNREWFAAEDIRSALIVPIMLDGSPIGVVACMARTSRQFSPADVALAAAVAAPAALAVRNARLYEDTLQRLEEIRAFQRVTSETLAAPDPEAVLSTVVKETRRLLRCDAAFCSLVDARTLQVQEVVAEGARSQEVPRYRLRVGTGLAGLVLSEKRAVRTEEYLGDRRFQLTPAMAKWAEAEGAVAMIVGPGLDAHGEIIALLGGYNRSRMAFTARHEATLTALAQQAALAIARARSLEEERRRARETAALLEIARICTSTLELQPLLRDLACQTARALGAERCIVNLWRGRQLVPVMAQYADGHHEPELLTKLAAPGAPGVEDVSAGAEATRLKQPVVVEDAALSPLVPARWVEAFGIRSLLVVPLLSKDQAIGTLSLDDSRGPRQWAPAQVDLAMTIAAQVALAVDNARHYEEAQQRAAEVQTLSSVGEALTSTLNLQEVLDAIADSARSLIGAQRAVVFELDQPSGYLRARAIHGIGIEPGLALRMGQGAAGAAALRGAPVWSADVLQDPPPGYDTVHEQSGLPLGQLIRRYGYRGILAVPVLSRATALGAVCIYWDEVHEPEEREIRLLSALARQAAIAMDNARLVADLRRTLDDLKAAQDTLVRGATLRAVGELAAGAAHHLNNLMAVVLGRTQLLLMREPPGALVTSLRTIERAAVEAADTVRRIQAFSKTDTGAGVAAIDLNGVIRESLELTRPRWEHEAQLRGVRIEVAFDAGPLPKVPGRPADIREAVANLILNAVDALPRGGRIAIRSWREGARALVSVSDTGVGMPEQVRRRIFEPFFTTKGVKSTGLGLPVAYGAIRRHGGGIAVESVEGRGTAATFWLPLGAIEQGGEGAAEPATGEPRGAILIIDDEAPVRELVADVLTAQGHTVTAAAHGREGIERFNSGRYDLVITDLGMPDMTGWDVARAIRASSPETPVVLLTGWGELVEPPEGVRVDGVVSKPFEVARLAAAVADVLRARR